MKTEFEQMKYIL